VAENLSYGLVNLGMATTKFFWRVKQAIVHFDLEALWIAGARWLSLGEKSNSRCRRD